MVCWGIYPLHLPCLTLHFDPYNKQFKTILPLFTKKRKLFDFKNIQLIVTKVHYRGVGYDIKRQILTHFMPLISSYATEICCFFCFDLFTERKKEFNTFHFIFPK